jgi:hypothetical protein
MKKECAFWLLLQPGGYRLKSLVEEEMKIENSEI